jgi:hypothetical protein
VNITAVYPRAAGYLTAWNGNAQSSIPLASTLNYRGGQIVSNMAIVPVCLGCWTGNDFPTIGVFSSQETHVIVDIVGFYDDGQSGDGLRLNPITPTRVTDTRFGLGLPGALFQATTGKITPSTGVLPTGTQALALNVTAVQPSGNTFITVWPQGIDGIGQPMVSNLNPSAGAVVPNAAYTLLGPTSAFNVYNNAGSTHLVVDVVGTFYRYPAVPSALSRNPGPGRELRLAPTAPPATRHPAG